MKIHDLTFRGMGPFADEQHIDFASLSEAGMFLLEGPTGVGKSTIIDAIVFALYGSVAVTGGDADRLDSDFRDPGQEPFVEMVFQTAQGIYRVRRSPGHQRPRARATSATDLVAHNATATLLRLTSPTDPGGEPLAYGPAEVGKEVKQAVGLDRDQFVSTIVLPQGEFATFLRTGSKERLPILQKIFRTQHFQALQERLKLAGRSANEQRGAARDDVVSALDTFRGAVGTTEEVLADVDADTATDSATQSVQRLLEELSGRRESAQDAQTRAAADHEAAQQELAAIDKRRALRDELVAALVRRRALEDAAAEVQQHELNLADDDRAARVADAVAQATRAEHHLDRAARDLQTALATSPQRLSGLSIEQLVTEEASMRKALGALSEVLRSERDIAALEKDADDLDGQVAQLAAADEDLQRQADAIPAQVEAKREALDGHRRLADSAEQLGKELQQAKDRTEAAEDLVTAETRALELDSELADALSELTAADDAAQRASRAYRDGIAATIGASLEPDQPCPACGSLDHPNPAVPGEDHVGVAEVDAAQARAEGFRTAVDRVKESRSTHAALSERLRAGAAGLTADAGRARVAELQRDLALAQHAASLADDVTKEIAQLEEEGRTLAAAAGKAARDGAAAAASAAQIRSRVLGIREGVHQQLMGFPTIAARVADLESVAESCKVLAEHRRTHEGAAHAARRANAAQREALDREGFADAGQVHEARLSAADRQAAAHAVAEDRAETARVDAILDREDLQGLDPAEEIDRGPAAASLSLAEDELQRRNREVHEADHVRRQALQQAASIERALQRRDGVYTATEAHLLMARLAEGKNAIGIDLATFVLVHRFRSVIEAANLHLTHMSNGRLILETFEDVEKKNQKAGLGIRVRDLHTETLRTPKTLSGGETFYASLSLALGLAEIVSAESGGVELDTLFVDEGFGSLDQETLDKVMAVLDGLQRNGRVLGLVSHVTEMKERIAERVEVRRVHETGPSTLRVVS